MAEITPMRGSHIPVFACWEWDDVRSRSTDDQTWRSEWEAELAQEKQNLEGLRWGDDDTRGIRFEPYETEFGCKHCGTTSSLWHYYPYCFRCADLVGATEDMVELLDLHDPMIQVGFLN